MIVFVNLAMCSRLFVNSRTYCQHRIGECTVCGETFTLIGVVYYERKKKHSRITKKNRKGL